jgi:hypothetical protein
LASVRAPDAVTGGVVCDAATGIKDSELESWMLTGLLSAAVREQI